MNFASDRQDNHQLVAEGEVTTYHPVKRDEDLYAHARSQWRDGEWGSLIRLDIKKIETHPEKAKLALIVASAWLQQGDNTASHSYLHRALEWGCDKKLVAQILIAGVHNSLGRAAAIASDQVRMERHFHRAIAGGGFAIQSDILGRQHTELHRLGLEQTAKDIAQIATHSLNNQENAINYPPQGITSYAQNFEDVMLWRAVWNVENGCYIDVGAWDPVVDSVSKGFYEKGWRGVHVEPLPEYTEKIRRDRPDERVYQVLLGAEQGESDFYYIPETGLSTTSKEFAEMHQKVGLAIEKRKYKVATLDKIFDEIGDRDINWMKIDVEGMESDVIAGWRGHPARPWIILVEATKPNCPIPTWFQWQLQLEALGYIFVYFDGLNRFYVHKNHENLIPSMRVPPNIFDNYRKI